MRIKAFFILLLIRYLGLTVCNAQVKNTVQSKDTKICY